MTWVILFMLLEISWVVAVADLFAVRPQLLHGLGRGIDLVGNLVHDRDGCFDDGDVVSGGL